MKVSMRAGVRVGKIIQRHIYKSMFVHVCVTGKAMSRSSVSAMTGTWQIRAIARQPLDAMILSWSCKAMAFTMVSIPLIFDTCKRSRVTL